MRKPEKNKKNDLKKRKNTKNTKKPDENMLAEAGRLAAADSEPMEDLRGSAEYKRALVNELTQRAIKLSLQRAEGSR